MRCFSRLARYVALAVILIPAALPSSAGMVCYYGSNGGPTGVNVPGANSPTEVIAALASPPVGYESAVPAGTGVGSVVVEPELVTVDFSQGILVGGLDEARFEAICEQVRLTLSQFPLPGSVLVTASGTPLYKCLPPDPVIAPGPEANADRGPIATSLGLGGRKISLSPGHGLHWNGSGWSWERPENCPPLLREDLHNDEIIRYLDTFLTQDGAVTKVYRCIDKNYGNYPTGTPWWHMSASYWLKNIGYPCSVYAPSTGSCTLGSGSSEVSDNISSRPLASDYDNTDIHVSLHSNALNGDCVGSCPTGTETFFDNSESHATWGAISQNLAQKVQDGLMDFIRNKYADPNFANRGIKNAAGSFAETRVPNRAAILIELAFHDTCDKDALYMQDTFFRSGTMWGVYKGICDYFGVTPTYGFYSYVVESADFPNVLAPGQIYTAHITLRNTGVLWNENHQMRLGAVGDSDPFTAQTRFTVSGDIEATQTVTFDVTLTAPMTPGVYVTDWRMVRESVTWFGTAITKSVTVAEPGSDTQPPTVPANLAGSPVGTNRINLTWNASTDNLGVTGYKIYRAGVQIGTSATTSYMDTGLTPNTTYSYQVSAHDAFGNESEKCGVVNATTNFTSQYNIDENLAVKVGAWTTVNGSGYGGDYAWTASTLTDIKSAKWTPNIEVAGYYDVYACWVAGADRPTNAPYTVVYDGGSVAAPANQTLNGGSWNLLASNKPFRPGTGGYIILNSGTGVAGKTLVADGARFLYKSVYDYTAPSVPGGLFASAVSTTQINLIWEASTDDVGTTGYKIYRDGSYLTSTVTNSFQDTGLSPNTLYLYEVLAYDAAGNESARSNLANAMTFNPADTTPPTIESVTATPAMTAGGFPVDVVVVATDNVAVVSVTAPGITFTSGAGNTWAGVVAASDVLGVNSVDVTAADAAGNQSTAGATYVTARAYAVSSSGLQAGGAIAGGSSQYVYKIWGAVIPYDTDSFDLSDGSMNPVRVHCPGHGLSVGQHITALGIWNPTATPPQLVTLLTHIKPYP